ncbi:hypothetical protein CR66_03640 [Campylobacter mucosalis]|uniref:hypothetical protein n=1 Tax=Campylobacter mucosalis TaxID=202 RepID=UPI0004D4B2D7|nr:hypothetical protein [Campylobacter mucosalis]KEA46287.1 hypothetical protein CR66_03640 [Campylobacter mucosalis]QKF62757.1 hypothetical protein CMCT_0603 [Campylobacter mucosalis]
MRKFLVILPILILAGWYFFKEQPASIQSDENSTLSKLECDLNKSPCTIKFGDKNITFELFPRPIYAMRPVWLSVEGLELKNPSIEAYGLNMDMGKIKAKFKKQDDVYLSELALSACLIDVMRYRFEILEDGKKSGIFIDFDLKN